MNDDQSLQAQMEKAGQAFHNLIYTIATEFFKELNNTIQGWKAIFTRGDHENRS